MKQATLDKVIHLLETFPEKKVPSLMDYINYLRDQEESFSKEEIALINSTQEDALYGRGVDLCAMLKGDNYGREGEENKGRSG